MSESKATMHGGNIYAASKSLGIEIKEIMDYSANINPLGLPVCLKENLISNIDNLINYPDPECTELKTEISAYLGIPDDMIVIGNGASEVIFLLLETIKPERVLIPAPTFSEYAQAARKCGAEVVCFELKEQDNYTLNVNDLILEAQNDINAIFIGNPNNPTSTLIKREELEKLIELTSRNNIYTIIDEAFIELTVEGNRNSVVDLTTKYKNLFIIRAFTKIFAMPGLRLGYGIGYNGIIKEMIDKKLPWSVNYLACCSGKVLSEGYGYICQTAVWLAEEKEWFYNELLKIPNLKVLEPQTNFVLIKILDDILDAGILKSNMAKRGILIRDASNFEFLNSKFFRVAIKDRSSNIKFLEILKESIK